MELLTFFAAPIAMCVILAGIHCYLGLHVLARGVIFVDLSLAQVAAFGSTLALVYGVEPHAAGAFAWPLAATFLASALFALARKKEQHFPQEAMIGVIYALAAGGIVIISSQLAHGSEHIRHLLVGQILWVSWHDVGITALIYATVGAIHYLFRKQFIANFFGGSTHSYWDLLFYGLFGIIITCSVSIVGVLQVFAYLIVPAIVSKIFYTNLRSRLIFGWILGAAISVLGMALSYVWDVPSGALIVVLFTAVPLVLLVIWPSHKKGHWE